MFVPAIGGLDGWIEAATSRFQLLRHYTTGYTNDRVRPFRQLPVAQLHTSRRSLACCDTSTFPSSAARVTEPGPPEAEVYFLIGMSVELVAELQVPQDLV